MEKAHAVSKKNHKVELVLWRKLTRQENFDKNITTHCLNGWCFINWFKNLSKSEPIVETGLK